MHSSQEELSALSAVLGDASHLFSDLASFEKYMAVASFISTSTIIPDAYRDNPANCLIAIEVASRTGQTFIGVTQSLQIIHGKPAWSGKFVISLIETCGRYKDRKFVFAGEPGSYDYGCHLEAVDVRSGQLVKGERVTWQMVVDRGWAQYEGSPWQGMSGLMYQYRAASFFGNLNMPDLLLGFPTVEEMFDITKVAVPAIQAGAVTPTVKAGSDVEVKKQVASAFAQLRDLPIATALTAPLTAPTLTPQDLNMQLDQPKPATPGRAKGKVDDVTGSLFDGMPVAPEKSSESRDDAALPVTVGTSGNSEGTEEVVEPVAAPAIDANTAAGEVQLHTAIDPSTLGVNGCYNDAGTEPDSQPAQLVAEGPKVDSPDEKKVANVPLSVVRELCLRARDAAGVLIAMGYVEKVVAEDRIEAEEELLIAANHIIPSSDTAAMSQLAKVLPVFSHNDHRVTYRSTYNARVRALNPGVTTK